MTAYLEHALRTTLAIERRRAHLFDALRAAVEDGDEAAVVRCARALVGCQEQDGEAESDCAPPCVEPGASRA